MSKNSIIDDDDNHVNYLLVVTIIIVTMSNKTLRSVHFGVVVVELIKCKCGGIVRNEIW